MNQTTPEPKAEHEEHFRRLDQLLAVALRLARTAQSGRMALAKVSEAIPSEWIPRPWGDPIAAELEAAYAEAVEPVPLGTIERLLREAWGVRRPTDELDDLDPEPVFVTPIAQVHRGTLEGAPVAVKVVRPNLARMVSQDLGLLEALAGPLGAAFPQLDVGATLHEIRERVMDDLDLDTQAQVQRRFHRALRDHPRIVVPAPVTRLAHETVLVSEWVEGLPLREAPEADRDRAAAELVLFAFGAARWGTVHADLDPSGVLVLEDGRIAIVDFGASRSVDPARVELSAQVVEAFTAEDHDGVARSVAELGWLPAERVPAAEALVRHALGELAGPDPTRLDTEAVIAARERLLEQPAQLVEMLLHGKLPPEELWPARGMGQLFSSIARVGATAPWRELVRAGLRDGWDARPPSG